MNPFEFFTAGMAALVFSLICTIHRYNHEDSYNPVVWKISGGLTNILVLIGAYSTTIVPLSCL